MQIHHIDGDPANTVLDNLAVLCLECHTQTQISGGFVKRLDPILILKYRDDWLNRVAELRARQTNPVTIGTSDSSNDAQTTSGYQLPKLLRTLYPVLLRSAEQLRDYAVAMGRPLANESFEHREDALEPHARDALKQVDETLPRLRIEPDCVPVCTAYNEFKAAFDQTMVAVVYNADHPHFGHRWSKLWGTAKMDDKLGELESAMQEHLKRLDANR